MKELPRGGVGVDEAVVGIENHRAGRQGVDERFEPGRLKGGGGERAGRAGEERSSEVVVQSRIGGGSRCTRACSSSENESEDGSRYPHHSPQVESGTRRPAPPSGGREKRDGSRTGRGVTVRGDDGRVEGSTEAGSETRDPVRATRRRRERSVRHHTAPASIHPYV